MAGRRRWQISAQKDLILNPDLPLKILQSFKPEQEWILEPGDMLYLPPHIAHDGIALDDGCQTWSVGFRSPSFKELLQEGLWRLAESLEDNIELSKRFADPNQEASTNAEQLPQELIKQVQEKLADLKLDQVETFLPGIASYLSEPKPQAYFDAPEDLLTPEGFKDKLSTTTLIPHPQTRLLSIGINVFCNGDNVTKDQPKGIRSLWIKLSADKRLDPQGKLSKDALEGSLFDAYEAGWLIFEVD